jgi:putative flippase GtrA
MNTFIKAQAALIAGSLADFGMTILLVQLFQCWYVRGNAAGNILGAVVQFILSRNWAFNSTKQKVPMQVIKFILMWAGNISLSALGVYLLTKYGQQHYLFSKTIVSVLLGVSYTYFVSKKFVFT